MTETNVLANRYSPFMYVYAIAESNNVFTLLDRSFKKLTTHLFSVEITSLAEPTGEEK
jgi:hypothetical protein